MEVETRPDAYEVRRLDERGRGRDETENLRR